MVQSLIKGYETLIIHGICLNSGVLGSLRSSGMTGLGFSRRELGACLSLLASTAVERVLSLKGEGELAWFLLPADREETCDSRQHAPLRLHRAGSKAHIEGGMGQGLIRRGVRRRACFLPGLMLFFMFESLKGVELRKLRLPDQNPRSLAI